MSDNTKEKSLMFRIFHFPLTRIFVGILICGMAMLLTNNLLKLIPGTEGDIPRVIRWVLSTSVLFVTYYYLFRIYEQREVTELAWGSCVKESLWGFLMGVAAVSSIIFILFLLGNYKVDSMGSVSALFMALFFFITAAALEEVIFRGIIYRIIEESLGTHAALALSAVLFGAAHMFNDHANLLSIISVASGGLLLGLIYSLKKRLWLPIAVHTGWNWSMASLGISVSGNDDFPAFLTARLEGHELLTGGEFGVENSLITIVVIVVVSSLLYTKVDILPDSRIQKN